MKIIKKGIPRPTKPFWMGKHVCSMCNCKFSLEEGDDAMIVEMGHRGLKACFGVACPNCTSMIPINVICEIM